MYDIVSINTPLTKGEIRAEYETNDRIAVTQYDDPHSLDGNVIEYISFQNDVLVDVIFHGVDATTSFLKTMEHIVGGRKFNIAEDIWNSLEMVSG